MVSMGKICTNCNRELPYEAFNKDKSRSDGRRNRCRECDAAYFREKYKDPEWKKAHSERAKQYRTRLKSEDPIKLWAKDALANAKQRARKGNFIFSLSMSDLIERVVPTCPLLGLPLVYSGDDLRSNAATLDKKYPDRGYTPDNIGIISHRANRLKSDSSIEELQTLLNNLIRYMESA